VCQIVKRMDFRVLFLIFCLSATSAVSQASPPDKKAVIDSLLGRSFDEYVRVNATASLEYALEAVSESERAGYSKGKAKGNFFIGQALWSLGRFSQSLEYLHLAEQEEYTAGDPLFLSEICRVKGRAYGSLNLYEASIREFKKGMGYIGRIKEDDKRNYLTSLAYENLSNVYHMRNMADSSFYYLVENLKVLEGMDEGFVFRSKINLYSQLGREHTAREQYDSTAYYLNRALSLSEKYNFPYTSWIYLHYGNMEKQRGNIDAALVMYHKGLDNLKETKLKNELPSIYNGIVEAYLKKKEIDSAALYQEKKMAIENELTESENEALEHAIKILFAEERQQQASKHQKTLLYVGIAAAIMILLASAGWFIWDKRNKKLVAEKENEVTELQEKLNVSAEELYHLAKDNDSSFLLRFSEIYSEFTQNLFRLHPDLTNSDFFSLL